LESVELLFLGWVGFEIDFKIQMRLTMRNATPYDSTTCCLSDTKFYSCIIEGSGLVYVGVVSVGNLTDAYSMQDITYLTAMSSLHPAAVLV
jgi:hypothetical protein